MAGYLSRFTCTFCGARMVEGDEHGVIGEPTVCGYPVVGITPIHCRVGERGWISAMAALPLRGGDAGDGQVVGTW